jgi:hypothetical protein
MPQRIVIQLGFQEREGPVNGIVQKSVEMDVECCESEREKRRGICELIYG